MAEYLNGENSNGYVNVPTEDDNGFDVRLLWVLLLRYKYWFVASVLMCLVSAFIYLRYTTPVYSIYSKVLIKDQDKKPYSTSSINSTFQELGFKNSSDGFDNEIEVLATKSLAKKTVKAMKLYTSYYSEGRVKNREIYGKYSPYLVDLEDVDIDSLKSTIALEIEEKGSGAIVKISYRQKELEQTLATIPGRIPTTFGTITLERNPLNEMLERKANLEATLEDDSVDEKETETLGHTLKVFINPLDKVAMSYAKSINVAPTSKTTTIASVSMNDIIPERGADYIRRLVEIYNEDANEDNNFEARRTEDFIAERLGIISKELNLTETELEQFKTASGIVDYVNDARVDATQNVQYETQIVEVATQLNLVEYILDYVLDADNYLQVIPSNVGLKDNSINTIILKYNEIVMERNRLLRSASEDNPAVTVLTDEATGYFNGIKSSLQSAKQQLTIQRNQLQGQYNKYNSKISSAPSKERALADINRQQEVKAGLYLMLLQKREENAITLASSAYKGKVIEDPIISGPVSPKKKIILLIAFVIGLALPYAYYFIRNFFRYRIEGQEDLMRLTNVPLIGMVPFIKALSKGDRNVVVQENRNSVVVEVYRSIRSNLPFVLSKGQNVIMFTSTTSGEGKTCIASNLAASIAFAGKKVVIVGLDIRKPRLAGLFNLAKSDRGISNFFTRSEDDYDYLESLIQKSDISPNLDIIAAGPVPPNPAELLEKRNLETAVEYLKKKYDYVLLDTAPIGLVSDTLAIGKVADATLFIVRANYTLKGDLDLVNTLVADKRLPNVNLILNAAKVESNSYSYKRYGGYGYGRRYGYGKSYGYGYGGNYGYGYGEKDGGKKLDEI